MLFLSSDDGIAGFKKWILFAEASTAGGGVGDSVVSPSGIAIAVTAIAGIALAATIVYSRRGSLKLPWSLRRRTHALEPKQWKSLFTEERRLNDGGIKFLKKVRSGGVDPSIRAEVWPFLLGVSWLNNFYLATGERESSDSDSSGELENTPLFASKITEENSIGEDENDNSTASRIKGRSKSHPNEDFTTWQRIIRVDAVRANDEWIAYASAQASVSEINVRQLAESVGLKEYDHLQPCRIYHAVRLVVILEAYTLYDPEIGYCQGMSDLLSPIISVVEDDFLAFWCFAGFMKKARHNFRLDEAGIRRQLNIVSKIIRCKDIHLYRHLEELQAEDCFFVYRMVVVLFRRELNFEQTLCLWEVVWADQAAIRAGITKTGWGRMRLKPPPTDDLLLYAIAACVLQRRKQIIEMHSSMDEIMRECNSMAGQLDVWKLLDDAHDLVVNLQDKI